MTREDFIRLQGASIFVQQGAPYQICSRCVMDTSDPEIAFDDEGVCHHCRDYDRNIALHVFAGEAGAAQLRLLVERIKQEGRGKPYDCLIGLSGGADSSYLAYLVKRWGLRPLAFHLDNGWNSEPAVRNIENIVRILDIDLHTEVLDWQEFRSLQLAFLRASTPDSEIPTDHAIVAATYRLAVRKGIRTIVDGSNLATEQMVPRIWSHGHGDWRYIKHLNTRFGGRPLRTYPHYTPFERLVWFPRVRGIRLERPLHLVTYNKPEALQLLSRELKWQDYGGKHHESIYTRFYQGHLLPAKFGFDKRRSHLSCLINDGRLTRKQALAEMESPALPRQRLVQDKAFVLKKLGLSESGFEQIMTAPRKTFWDYPSYERQPPRWLQAARLAKRARRALARIKRRVLRPQLS